MRALEGLAAILSAETWSRLTSAGNSRVYDPDQVLMHQGDPVDHVVVMLDGRVKVARVDPAGTTLVLAVRGPGEVIGELGLFNGNGRRSATVTAVDRCSARVVSVTEFTTMARDLGLEEQLLQHVANRLREGEDVRSELAVLPAGPRVIRCLLRLATQRRSMPTPGNGSGPTTRVDGRQDDWFDVGLNQTELGQAAGVHRSTVAEELRKLREDGIVLTSRRRIVITDVARLQERAGEA